MNVDTKFGDKANKASKGWFGAKMDENLFAAMKFFADVAGGEVGMNDYITQLSILSSDELKAMIEERYEKAFGDKAEK